MHAPFHFLPPSSFRSGVRVRASLVWVLAGLDYTRTSGWLAVAQRWSSGMALGESRGLVGVGGGGCLEAPWKRWRSLLCLRGQPWDPLRWGLASGVLVKVGGVPSVRGWRTGLHRPAPHHLLGVSRNARGSRRSLERSLGAGGGLEAGRADACLARCLNQTRGPDAASPPAPWGWCCGNACPGAPGPTFGGVRCETQADGLLNRSGQLEGKSET